MKPEKKASVAFGITLRMGTHGWSKVDCTTEWLCREEMLALDGPVKGKGMYRWPELELHDVADLRFYVVG